MHGEHENGKTYVEKKPGSPPHTRGTPNTSARKAISQRITPAYTGNTGMAHSLRKNHKDHPRIHGEHKFVCGLNRSQAGSPPHTRGTLYFSSRLKAALRITPAYTGNTLTVISYSKMIDRITPAYTGNTMLLLVGKLCIQDHPRIHGEHHNATARRSTPLGSPPHTRGTL